MTTGQTNRLAQILTRRIRGCLTLIKNVAQQSIDGTLDTAEWRKSFIDIRTKNV